VIGNLQEREGHIDVPQRHAVGETLLDCWLARQRMIMKSGRLDTERVIPLDNLGDWEFSKRLMRIANPWERNYHLLCKFYEMEGHCDISTSHGRMEANWVVG